MSKSGLRFWDLVEKGKWEGGKREIKFPLMFGSCTGCGGERSVYHKGKTIVDPELAYEFKLIYFGYAYIGTCDNNPPTHPCNCDERLPELREMVEQLPWIDRGEWEGRSGGRCITDYTRVLRFERDLTEGEEEWAREWLQRDDCPGWTGVQMIKEEKGVYRCETTWDSSD